MPRKKKKLEEQVLLSLKKKKSSKIDLMELQKHKRQFKLYTTKEIEKFIENLKKDEKEAAKTVSEITKKEPKAFNFPELKRYFGKGTEGEKKAGQYMELWKLEKRYRNMIDSFTLSTIDAGKVPDYPRRMVREHLISTLQGIRRRMNSLFEEGGK